MEIIFLPGLGQDATVWNNVIAHLNTELNTESLNLFSDIDENTEVTLDFLNKEVDKKLRTIKEPYILCGLSLGGILALSIAPNQSDFLQGLIVSGAQFESPNKLLIDLQNLMFRFMPNKNFSELGITKKQMIRFCQSMKSLNLRSGLTKLTTPTTIICGTKDKANLSAAKSLSSVISNSELKLIAGGHMLNEEKPLEFADTINSFYAKYF